MEELAYLLMIVVAQADGWDQTVQHVCIVNIVRHCIAVIAQNIGGVKHCKFHQSLHW